MDHFVFFVQFEGYRRSVMWEGMAEKSQAAILREQFAKDEFDKVRRRLDRTKVFNNEMIIRNSCTSNSKSNSNSNRSSNSNNCNNNNCNKSIFRCLPEIALLRIFQYARPENYQTQLIVSKKEHVGNTPRTYNRYEQYQWHKSRKEATYAMSGEMAEKKELAEASGVVAENENENDNETTGFAIGTATAAPVTSSVFSSSSSFVAAAVPVASRSISGRKRSSDQIGRYDSAPVSTSTGDAHFAMDLAAFEEMKRDNNNNNNNNNNTDNDSNSNTTDNDNDNDDDRKLRPVLDIIDSLHKPGWKFSTILLNPDTHMTGPCWRDFNRYVKTFPGWIARRYVATPEEKKKFRIYKQSKVYFAKIYFRPPNNCSSSVRAAQNAAAIAATKKKTADIVAAYNATAGKKKKKKPTPTPTPKSTTKAATTTTTAATKTKTKNAS